MKDEKTEKEIDRSLDNIDKQLSELEEEAMQLLIEYTETKKKLKDEI